jgi:outer membrane lipoprotein-sorting protein
MNRLFIFLICISFAGSLSAQTPTGEEILNKIDQNMVVDQAISLATMIVHGRTGDRTITSKNWIKGKDKAFVEYLSPAREKGTKMLKLGDQLWTYTPEPTDRIITISGHLLRQSVMGSDLSYEDMTENDKLVEQYDAIVEGEEAVDGRQCFVLKLTAKEQDVAYYARKLWVDVERWLPLKEERYAKSGKLLKTTNIIEVFQSDNRWYPKKMIFKDMLSTGKGTEYIIESIDFNAEIPDYMLTKAALRK